MIDIHYIVFDSSLSCGYVFVDQAKDNITIDWCVLANLPFVVFNCHQKNSLEVKDCQANFLLFDRVGFVGDQEPFAFCCRICKGQQQWHKAWH